MWNVWSGGEVFTGYWLGGPIGRDLWEDSRKLEDNIKMYLRDTEIDGSNRIRLAQDRVLWRVSVNTIMKLRVP
jgi:hypothetical protein